DTIIKYGTLSTNLDSEFKINNSTLFHYAEITGLIPETHYYFRIEDSLGNAAEVDEFTTFKDPGNYLFSFGVFADLHHTFNQPDDLSTGYLFGHADFFLNNLKNDFSRNTSSFIILKGDITNDGTQEQFDDFILFTSTPGFDSTLYSVIGNHDKRTAYWETAFLSLTSTGATNYSINYSSWHFIILDSAIEGDDAGHFSEETLLFLENDLNLNKGKKTLIFIHHLVNPIRGVTDNPYLDGSSLLADNYQEFKNVLDNYPNVWIVFSGHAHFNDVSFDRGVLYVVSASVIHYPCQYNIVHIYENAVVQEARKVSNSISWSEISRQAIYDWVEANYGFLGDDIPDQVVDGIYGELKDRCFLYIQGEYYDPVRRDENKIKVYPNPVKQTTKINFEMEFKKFEKILGTKLMIFDISGKKIFSGNNLNTQIVSFSPFKIKIVLDINTDLDKKPASGIYIYILKVKTSQNEFDYSGKIAFIK
ncbi:metallophosphoesterase family protein, partial [Candidatus Dependentiae bacterium]|nr:metallophosphoesterase family protein [Candidatus Dependentiae bacterium]